LGRPDAGLIFSTYLGYWLMGAALLALGMLASLLTDNLTIAFILGAILCAVPVFIDHAGAILSGRLQLLVESFSFRQQFLDLSSGVISLSRGMKRRKITGSIPAGGCVTSTERPEPVMAVRILAAIRPSRGQLHQLDVRRIRPRTISRRSVASGPFE
jgi:hypothetical protein